MATAREAKEYVHNFNRFNMPSIPANLGAGMPPIYIFNVGPRAWHKDLGGVGHYFIPACPAGKEYSEPCVVKGILPEIYNTVSNNNLALNLSDGMKVAEDIVGVAGGPPSEYTTNKQWFGVFISETNPPAKEEVKAAKERLFKMAELLFNRGNRLALAGPDGVKVITENERWANDFLGQNAEWAKPIQRLSECPGCGDPVKPNVITHTCGYVFDWDKAVSAGMRKAEDRPEPKTKKQ